MNRRIFIAIPLPPEIREKIRAIQNTLRVFDWPVRWESPDKLHITLRFLGLCTEEQLERVRTIVRRAAEHARAFQITMRNLVAFPSLKLPRVICIKLGESAELSLLQKNIARQLDAEEIGEYERYPFTGHVTIGRLAPAAGNYRALAKVSFWGMFEAGQVDLMESVLRPGGSEYAVLNTFRFVP